VALAIDGSTPAIVTSTSTTVATLSTGSFTPPAGALLLIAWAGNSHIATNPSTPTITDSLGSPLTYTLLDWQSRANSPTVDGQAAMWWAVVGSSAAMTVTTTINVATDNEKQQALQVIVITGQDSVTPIGAHGKSGSTSSSAIAQNYTAAATGGQGFIAVCDWDSLGNFTAGTGCTIPTGGTGTIPTTQISYGFAQRTTADDSNGVTNTLRINPNGTSTHLNWVYAEVLPAAAATSIPYNPQRNLLPYRDPSETPFIQKDRRNALTVATAANPLPSPLDVSWQDGGRYWHLYNDVPLRTSQVYYQQKDLRNANLVATAGSGLPSPLDASWGAGGRYWHLYGDAADAAPRTWQSLQRAYVSDLSLLVPLVDADPLLVSGGEGGDTWRRYNTAVTHDDRRQTVPQRVYFADIDVTSMVGTGALGAWWGVDDTAAFLYGNQRRASDPSLLVPPGPLDPVLAGYLPGLILDNRASLFVDRREAPQQRAYISDPSFYPTVPPTDPLTLAWGVEGHYWLLYNQPAMFTDRREVPQQRAYVSDPSLLLTALLESPLLGNGDVGRHAQTFTDRREVPAQPSRLADQSMFLADPLILLADVWRRYNVAATHDDRRETAWQPPRWTVYTTLPPPPPDVLNATSTDTVIAGRTSTATVVAVYLSSSSVTGRATSTPSVSDG
jgi:hypothetical protein